VKQYHILNLGAGVQSTALYLMFMEGVLTPKLDAAIFADTQDEPAEVYKHLDWLDSLNGPRIIRTSIGKLSDDLLNGMNSTGQRWVSIPAYRAPSSTDAGEGRLRRQCSKEYKIIPIQQAIRREVLGLAPGARVGHGITVHQYLGISLDESGRAARIRKAPRAQYLRVHFPLIEQLFMARAHCQGWLKERVPHEVPRSACRYCPFHGDSEWARLKQQPKEWEQVIAIDNALRSEAVTSNRKRQNTQPMYLHRSLQPLVQIDFSSTTEKPVQSWIGFSRECMGVCGI
jgi:hypothetical protein